MAELIRLEQVAKGYSPQASWVLENINILVSPGEQWVIQGPSGSGKTTLLHIMGLLDRPSSGQVYFLGNNVATMRESERARCRNQEIGFIFQQFYLLPELTVLDNVNLPARIRGRKSSELLGASLLTKVGLQGKEHVYPHTLSGGEQQRVAIARALSNQPKIILADEPTGNLELELGLDIVHLLLDLCRQQQVSLVLVTHNQRLMEIVKGKNILLNREGLQ